MGLFDKLKKFLFGSLTGKRKKRRKSSPKSRSKKRAGASRKKRKTASKAPRKTSVKKLSSPRVPKPKKLSKTSTPPSKRVKPALKKAVLSKSQVRKKAGQEKRLKKAAPVNAPAAEKKVKDPGLYMGSISHYFAKVKAAVIPLEETLKVGDKIWIGQPGGAGFRQSVKSLQINRIPIDEGRPGEEVGLEVTGDVHVGDKVYRLKAGN